jgi:hypothetical protein
VGLLSDAPKPPKRVIIATEMVNPTVLIDEIFLALDDKVKGPALEAELRGMSFLVVDNLATMAFYNTHKDIAEFFVKTGKYLDRFPNHRVYMVAARSSADELHAEAKRFAQLNLDIPDEWLTE